MSCLQGVHVTQTETGPKKYGAARPPAIPSSWSVPAWFINPSTGNDENTCTDSSHPCQHWYEITSRWGTSRPIIQSSVVVTLLADQPDQTDCFEIRPVMVADAALFNFVGQLTQTASGSLGTVTAKNRSTSTLLQANIGGAATGSQGLMLVNATRSNAVTWVDSVSGSVATLTQPFGPSVTTPPAWWNGGGATTPAEVDTFASSDSFTLQRSPKACVTALAPTTLGAWQAAGGDGILAMMGHIWVTDSTNTHSFLTNPSARITESRIDSVVEYETTANNGVGEQIFNTFLSGSGIFEGARIFGGSIGSPTPFLTFLKGGGLDGDIIVHGNLAISTPAGTENITTDFGLLYSDGSNSTLGGTVSLSNLEYGGPTIYGTYTLNVAYGGQLYYTGGAASAFQGAPTLQLNGVSFASAYDRLHTPAQSLPHIAITPANLDLALGSGGFGGVARGGESVIASTNALQDTTSPSAYFQAGTGIGLSGGNGTPLTITNTSPGGGGVASVSGSTGITVSPTTGAPVVTLQTPVTVANGGTGDTTFTTDGVLYGNGTSPIGVTVPGTALLPFVSQGGSAPPTWQTLTVTGGGTGFGSCAVNGIVTGSSVNSISPLQCLAPSQLKSVPGPIAFATGSCNIGSSFATCGSASITLNIGTGQTAYIFAHSTVRNTATATPANGFLVLLEINGAFLLGEATTGPAPGSGIVNETDVDISGMMQNTISSGSTTFSLQLAHTEGSAVSGGLLQSPTSQIFGFVGGP